MLSDYDVDDEDNKKRYDSFRRLYFSTKKPDDNVK